MKRIIKSRLFAVILTAAICISTTAYAAIKLQASEVSYNGTTVEEALNELRGGPTKVNAETGETHKGIVYLDPTNLNKKCDSTNSVSTTEVKTGCMKWYIFDDSGVTYKLILDHNTTAKVQWNTANSNVSYDNSIIKTYVDQLVSSNKWVIIPRLITGQEVANITNNTSWNNRSDWYCLGSNAKDYGNTDPYCNKTKNNQMAWLFNNLTNCSKYGCDYEDNNTYTLANNTSDTGKTSGFYTSTTYTADSAGVYRIDNRGLLDSWQGSNYTSFGVRPVIEISKSVIK